MALSQIFVQIKLTCLITLFDRKLQIDYLGIFVLSNEDVELEINCKMRLFDSLSTTVMSFKSAGALKRELDGQYSTLL